MKVVLLFISDPQLVLSASSNLNAEGNQAYTNFGFDSDFTAGDVNGDGYSDVIVEHIILIMAKLKKEQLLFFTAQLNG
ncbi:MAG: FG-GAP repeat protein [Ignavibacteria bacterium]|nr:FG-GAP repeat protein [Ignavibacteria bacterium]